MSRYNSTSPMGAFQWPIDTIRREQGELEMDYDDVMAYVHNTGRTYWIGRFYKNYNGLLNGYFMFSHSERFYHFIMDYDARHVQIGVDYDGYPTPAHFYLARTAIMTGTSWIIAEYNAVPDPHEAPIPTAPIPAAPIPKESETDEPTIAEGGTDGPIPAAIPAAPIPEEGETDEPTIAEGGSDFVYKGLLLFLSLVIFQGLLLLCYYFKKVCFCYLLLLYKKHFKQKHRFEIHILCTVPVSLKKRESLLLLFYSFRKFVFFSSIQNTKHFKQKHRFEILILCTVPFSL